ncbi:MAG: hypothetical protein AB8G96_16035 [Phycisphaerales bacterium]
MRKSAENPRRTIAGTTIYWADVSLQSKSTKLLAIDYLMASDGPYGLQNSLHNVLISEGSSGLEEAWMAMAMEKGLVYLEALRPGGAQEVRSLHEHVELIVKIHTVHRTRGSTSSAAVRLLDAIGGQAGVAGLQQIARIESAQRPRPNVGIEEAGARVEPDPLPRAVRIATGAGDARRRPALPAAATRS